MTKYLIPLLLAFASCQAPNKYDADGNIIATPAECASATDCDKGAKADCDSKKEACDKEACDKEACDKEACDKEACDKEAKADCVMGDACAEGECPMQEACDAGVIDCCKE
ncbi:MAG: hypothetical protein QGF46_00060 [Planctomycetota bacterium]|nr:hypothetical protein [Planctomycetota bacterium]